MQLNSGENGRVAPASHVMWSFQDIAKRDEVTRQAVSQKVGRLLKKHPDLSVERDHNGRVLRVNVAQYDHILQRYGDAAKAPTKDAPYGKAVVSQDSIDEAKKRQAWLTLERTSIELSAQKKMLVRVEQLEEALDAVGAALAAVFDRLPNQADDLAAAHSQDGMQGLRIALKKLGVDLRVQVADILSKISVPDNADAGVEEEI